MAPGRLLVPWSFWSSWTEVYFLKTTLTRPFFVEAMLLLLAQWHHHLHYVADPRTLRFLPQVRASLPHSQQQSDVSQHDETIE
jgi:hypothetical protein